MDVRLKRCCGRGVGAQSRGLDYRGYCRIRSKSMSGSLALSRFAGRGSSVDSFDAR